MGQDVLVGYEIEEGSKLTDELLRTGFDVAAACWLCNEDYGGWNLYIASSAVDDLGLLKAYGLFNEKRSALPDLRIDMIFDVRLIGATDPIAMDVISFRDSYPERRAVRTSHRTFGSIWAEDGYIYPAPPVPTAH